MVDIPMFKAQCALNELTLQALAAQMGICEQSLARKVKGKSEFIRNELSLIIDALKLDDDTFMSIFFERHYA